MNTYAVDFETYYDDECSIKRLEARRYFEHPLFECYLVSVVGTDGSRFVGDPRTLNWSRIMDGHWVSHNASFDEHLYMFAQNRGWFGNGFHPRAWDCSADLCAYNNWPRALAKAHDYLFGEEASKETRRRMHGKRWNDMDPGFQQEVRDYALKDSELCLKIWTQFQEKWPEWEREVSRHTRKMVRRGIPVNPETIRKGIEDLNQQLYDLREKIPWADDGETKLLSRIALDEECWKRGLIPPKSLAMDNPEAAEWIRKHGETVPFVEAVGTWRRVNMLCKKLQNFEQGIIGDRFYGNLMYCGAHTRRWSGGGGTFNLQNIPREEMFGVDFRSAIEAGPGRRIIATDLSQIEVRTVMWLAGDHDMLDRIRRTDDIYHAFGIQFGMWDESKGPLKNDPDQRHKVKGMVLGAQFGASGKAYQAMNGGTLEEANGRVELYRHRMPRVVNLWNRLSRGINTSTRDGEYMIELPSGNTLHYRNIRRVGGGLVCELVKNGNLVDVRPWHGMLIENCAQALARDIFADRILELERRGVEVLTHTHDEIVTETKAEDSKECARTIHEVMTTPPEWIPDIPLGCKVKIMNAYEK